MGRCETTERRGRVGWRVLAALFAVGLIVAACGDSDDELVSAGDETVVDSGDSGGAAGTCPESDPDCGDNPAVDGPAGDEGPDAPGSSGMTVDGGLSVSEALATDATGPLAVQGHLFDDGSGLVLCESLAGGGEAYLCDGASVPLEGLPLDEYEGSLIHQGGVSYTDGTITVVGEIVDGVLIVDPLSA
jgi:hypothetical protein